MTKIIGLTGGIGSGKTTVAGFFRDFGIPIYTADEAAKTIMQQPAVINSIMSKFSTAVFHENTLDRSKLAEVVFGDSDKLRALNEIVHPKVIQDFKMWLRKYAHAAFVIKESAILFESGSDVDCDIIITVTAPLDARISRLMLRTNMKKVQILKRVESQWTDEQRILKSDFTIDNENLDVSKTQVAEILKKLQNR